MTLLILLLISILSLKVFVVSFLFILIKSFVLLGIQGVVQAFVNGGTEEYVNVFFRDEGYLQEYPQHKDFVKSLKELLLEQDKIMANALSGNTFFFFF